MAFAKFLLWGAVFLSLSVGVALSQDTVTESPQNENGLETETPKPAVVEKESESKKAPNCTAERAAFMEQCAEPLIELKGSVEEQFMDLAFSEDPANIWNSDKYCSAPEELGTFIECYYGKIEECHASANMSDDLPDPMSTKQAVMYLCDEKDNLYKTQNASDFEECIGENLKGVRGCLTGYVMDKPSSASDKCILNDKMVSCVVKVDECTGEPVFETYVGYFRPAHCAACSIVGTWAVLLAATMIALFN